jgi:hypothetical protein
MSDALSPTRWWKGLLLLMLVAAWWRALHGGGVALGAVWTAATLVVWLLIDGRQRRARQGFIESSPMPRHLRREVFARYPSLTERQFDDIERGLRQFFICHLRARRFVSMPSQAVDALWHAFILDTRAYGRFCARAFGRFLHHSPAQTLGRDARRNDGLRRTWFHACRLEGIDPRAPAALPLLFALDAALAIPGGFVYQPDCGLIQAAAASGVHCGTSFSDGGVAGDAATFGGEDGSGGGGGADGDGGGDGGGGCGGGD